MLIKQEQSKTIVFVLAIITSAVLCSCAHHATPENATAAIEPLDIDELLESADKTSASLDDAEPAEPLPAWQGLRYTLDLYQVPMAEVISQLATDAQLQLFIDGRLQTRLNLYVRDQSIIDILAGIERQSDMFIDINGDSIVVLNNDYEFRAYAVGYPNMHRQTRSHIQTSLQLAVNGNNGAGGDGGLHNQSLTEVSNSSENAFWNSLVLSIESIIENKGTTTKPVKAETKGQVIAHPESGRLMVYANRRQHRIIKHEIGQLMKNMYRQVLIEATVIEIELSNSQRNGLNWQAILGGRWRLWQQDRVGAFEPTFGVSYKDDTSNGITNTMIELLESFGNVRVVSQPKLMALNNQSAVLKVVDERVYFTTQVENILNENTSNISYETTIHSVPVGFTMSITPWIGENLDVILNLKPSLTRIVRMVEDPNPALAMARVSSEVPELQIREMETIMRIRSGHVGVIGGLIQEIDTRNRSGIPKLHTAPGVGWMFGSRRKDIRRSELLILLKPVVDSG